MADFIIHVIVIFYVFLFLHLSSVKLWPFSDVSRNAFQECQNSCRDNPLPLGAPPLIWTNFSMQKEAHPEESRSLKSGCGDQSFLEKDQRLSGGVKWRMLGKGLFDGTRPRLPISMNTPYSTFGGQLRKYTVKFAVSLFLFFLLWFVKVTDLNIFSKQKSSSSQNSFKV